MIRTIPFNYETSLRIRSRETQNYSRTVTSTGESHFFWTKTHQHRLWVIMYIVCHTGTTGLALGQQCAISSFSEYIRCAMTSFYLRKSLFSWNEQSLDGCDCVEICWLKFRTRRLKFFNSKWHKRAFLLFLQKIRVHTDWVWVLLFHSCAPDCLKMF